MVVKDTWIDKIADTILSFFDKLEKSIEKHPIIGRLLSILLVIGIICWLGWKLAFGIITVFVWFTTAMIEIGLMPIHFIIWLSIGKFPMFDMHEYILKKLGMFDLVYSK